MPLVDLRKDLLFFAAALCSLELKQMTAQVPGVRRVGPLEHRQQRGKGETITQKMKRTSVDFESHTADDYDSQESFRTRVRI